MLNEGAVVDQFVAAMRAEDIPVSAADIVADGKIHRIHVEGDARGARNGWYVLHMDDHPAGMFGCNKRYGNDTKFNWKSTQQRAAPLTAAERRELRERMQQREREREEADAARHAAAAALAVRIWDGAAEVEGDAHPYLQRKRVKSHGLKVGSWEKLNTKTGELSCIEKDALLVPIRDRQKRIHSLQAILPNANNALGRDKDYLKDGDKRGRFYSIGKPQKLDGKIVILICEGYATGATLHECSGHAVVVAFDAPNLLPVAQVTRENFPGAIIVICADNDQWTLTPVKNPGIAKAREAAAAIGGLLAYPPFTDADGRDDEEGKRRGPTDFNDYFDRYGEDAVHEIVERALMGESVEENQAGDAPPWEGDGHELSTAERLIADAMAPVPGYSDDLVPDNRYFRLLGYNKERYYVYQKERKQIVTMTKSDLSEVGFLELARLSWWEMFFPNESKGGGGGLSKRAAANWFINECAKLGIYDPTRVRGRGAWLDAGRVVYHHGNMLSIDGAASAVTGINSHYVYELSVALPAPASEALSDDDGRRIVELAKRFRWSTPGSAALLAGFVMLAPLCGALKWRPHIWLTGGAGCGKSTVMNDFIHPLMGGADIFAQGNSSEAGLRQTLETDARPVLFDESESNEEGDARRIQNILSLIRQSSTESDAKVYKGTAGGQAMSFHVRSMFCLASIQVAIKHQADIERLTVLGLRPKREDGDAAGSWIKLQESLAAIAADGTMPARLLRRGLDLLPTIRQSIKVFAEVAANRFGSQREGDQYGTLLAGAWSLVSRNVVTHDEAEKLINNYDWSEHRDTNDSDESMRSLSALMESKLTHLGTQYSVFELVHEAAGEENGIGIGVKAAEALLGRAGMRVRNTDLLLSNQSQQLKRQVENTPYAADLRGLLLRLPGATRNDHKAVRFSGVLSKCISIPLGPILRDPELTAEVKGVEF